MQRPRSFGLVEIEDRRPEGSDARQSANARELCLESIGQRNVIGVDAGDIPTLRELESTVERRCKSELFRIRQHRQPPVGDIREERRGSVRGGIVDDDEREVVDGLPQHAFHRRSEIAGVVVDGQENRDERHGR